MCTLLHFYFILHFYTIRFNWPLSDPWFRKLSTP